MNMNWNSTKTYVSVHTDTHTQCSIPNVGNAAENSKELPQENN